ncbi:MAG: 30S ribosomal protein S6 [Candidatus Pacebacteria bacterium]|nr:30S ribosomal protein S6 [Candidatus Paceibacterota bacterium]
MKEPKVYEVGYLLVPQITEESLDEHVDIVRKIITDQGGLPIAEGRPELIDLAYIMTKDIDNKRNQYNKGFFGWIKFDVSPERAPQIKKELDALKIMIRNLLITTVREDTKIKIGSFSRTAKKDDVVTDHSVPAEAVVEDAPELTEEEFDKKIDELAGEE